ncbi:hypothetical protein K439DRAFT_1623829 [Ramaria rubella]|nr:hypothetical protein K439DRAFT_1623829 [Ramaria rubella]
MELRHKQWVAPQPTRGRGHGCGHGHGHRRGGRGDGGQGAPATNDPTAASILSVGWRAIDQEHTKAHDLENHIQSHSNTPTIMKKPPAALPEPSSTSFAPQPGSHTPLTSSDLSLPMELQPPTNVSQLFNLPASFLADYIPGGSLKPDWNVDVDFDLDYVEQEHVDEDGSGDVDVWVPEGEHDMGHFSWQSPTDATRSVFSSSVQQAVPAYSELPTARCTTVPINSNSVLCPSPSLSEPPSLATDANLNALLSNKHHGVDLYNDLRAKHERQVANSIQTASLTSSSSSSMLAVQHSSRSRGLSVSLLKNASSTKSMLPLSVNPPTSPAISSAPSHWSNNSFPSHPKSPAQPSPSEPCGDSDLQWDGHLLKSALPETKAFIMAADVGYKQCLLIHHMFPEVVSKSHEFLCLAFDEPQAVCSTDYTYPMMDHFEKYLVKNSRSWRGGLVTRVVPEVLLTFNLTTLYPVDEIRRQVAANLAKNTNFVFEKVSITTSSDIMMTPSGKPMRTGQFKHACVEKAILHIAFRDKQAAAAIAPHAFCPVPLPLIAFGCVAIHYALEVETLPNGAARPQLDWRTYNTHYTTYMDSLRAFTVSHADESLAVQNFLWNSGRIHASIPLEAISNDVSFDESLSEEEFG